MSFAVEASRATKPYFYRAPYPENLPNGMTVKEFQLAAVEYCVARDHAMVGDEPGLCKTATSIILSNAIGAGKTLVVSPASLLLNWEREVWAWSTLPNVSTYPVIKSKDGISPAHDYVIMSYDLLRNLDIFEAVMALRWDHLILDEAHYLKNPKGNRRTQAVCGWQDKDGYIPGLMDVVGRLTLLTGTPMPNQPIEIYNAARMLNWDSIDCMSLDSFRKHYYGLGGGMIRGMVLVEKDDAGRSCEPHWAYKLHMSHEVRNVPRYHAELQERIRAGFMVRRLKSEVMSELPEKQWHPFPLVTTPAMRKALKHPGWSRAEKLYEMDPDNFSLSVPIDGEISTARRLLGEAKAPAVADYIDELFASGITKLVVAAWHHSVLDYLRKRLAKYGLVYMDGNTSTRNKQLAVDRFQNEDEIGIIEGQFKPLGMGWTLTRAQDAVLAEFDWVPGNNDQLLDRIHRTSQIGDYLLGHVPVVPNTIDERIFGTSIGKARNINLALDA